MRKIFFILIICIVMTNVILPIYADDELDENSITEEELQEIMETVATATNAPAINSRYAIIYDRTSRRNIIWKGREYKM